MVKDLAAYMSAIAEVTAYKTRQISSDWPHVIRGAIEVCDQHIAKSETYLVQAYLEHFDISPFDCNVKFMAMMNCIYYYVYISCPLSAWDDSKLSFSFNEFYFK